MQPYRLELFMCLTGILKGLISYFSIVMFVTILDKRSFTGNEICLKRLSKNKFAKKMCEIPLNSNKNFYNVNTD